MRIQWALMVLCLILLVPPLPLSASLRRFLKSRRNPTASLRSLLRTWQNWVDLLRAGAGAYLLTEFVVQMNPEIPESGTKALVLEGAVLGLALLFQTVRLGQGVQLVAPIFYLCGFTVALGGYAAGGFAVFVGWLFTIGGKNPVYQLPIMGVALLAAGYLLDLNLRLLLACGLIFVPLVLAFLSRRPLSLVAHERAVVPT